MAWCEKEIDECRMFEERTSDQQLYRETCSERSAIEKIYKRLKKIIEPN